MKTALPVYLQCLLFNAALQERRCPGGTCGNALQPAWMCWPRCLPVRTHYTLYRRKMIGSDSPYARVRTMLKRPYKQRVFCTESLTVTDGHQAAFHLCAALG